MKNVCVLGGKKNPQNTDNFSHTGSNSLVLCWLVELFLPVDWWSYSFQLAGGVILSSWLVKLFLPVGWWSYSFQMVGGVIPSSWLVKLFLLVGWWSYSLQPSGKVFLLSGFWLFFPDVSEVIPTSWLVKLFMTELTYCFCLTGGVIPSVTLAVL